MFLNIHVGRLFPFLPNQSIKICEGFFKHQGRDWHLHVLCSVPGYIQIGISQLVKEHSLRRPQYMHCVAKGDFPCFIYWRMKVGKLRLWINWHCIHTLGPSKKMKNSSWSCPTCQWIHLYQSYNVLQRLAGKILLVDIQFGLHGFLWKIHLIVMQSK